MIWQYTYVVRIDEGEIHPPIIFANDLELAVYDIANTHVAAFKAGIKWVEEVGLITARRLTIEQPVVGYVGEKYGLSGNLVVLQIVVDPLALQRHTG